MALKLKFVKGRCYKTYNTKEVKKERKEEAKEDEEATAEEEQEAPIPLLTHVENILQSIFSDVEVYINNQQIYNSIGLYAHKSHNSNNIKGSSLKTREFCTARGTTMKNFLMKL